MQRLLGLAFLPRRQLPDARQVGSCVFNIVAILGITALVMAVAVPMDFLRLEMWAMLVFLCGRGT